MAKTHLDTAYEIGVQSAIEAEGYKTAADLQKDATELGLFETKTAASATSDDAAIAALKAKLG